MKNMKANILTPILAILLVGIAGCNKDSTARQDIDKAASDASDAIKQGGEEVAQDLKQAGEAVASDVTKKAEELSAPVNAKAQEVIDGAKKLFNDGKLQDALAKLKELDSEKLSEEQQALTRTLTARINKALSGKSPGTLQE